MRKSGLLILLLISGMMFFPFSTTTVAAKPQAERTDVRVALPFPVLSHTCRNYTYQKYQVVGQDIRAIYGNFSLTNGTGICFFICNSSTFDNWNIASNPHVPSGIYQYQQNVSSYRWAFHIPYNDTWQIIFYNANYSYTEDVNALFGIHYTPPLIVLTGASENQTVSGVVMLRANGTGSYCNVSWMSILIDNTQKVLAYGGYAYYAWDTTKLSEGWYTVEVLAQDQMGLGAASVIAVYVNNTPPPDLTPLLIIGGIVFAIIIVVALASPSSEKKTRKRLHRRYHHEYSFVDIPVLF